MLTYTSNLMKNMVLNLRVGQKKTKGDEVKTNESGAQKTA